METAEIEVSARVNLLLPVNQLISLIKEKIEEGDRAISEANKYYFEAGLYLLKLRPQIYQEAGEKNENQFLYWEKWVEKNIHRKPKTVIVWMRGARRVLGSKYLKNVEDIESARAHLHERVGSKTLNQVARSHEHPSHRPRWHFKVKPLLPNQYDIKRLRAQRLEQEQEQRLQHQLGSRLIDIGYKVLASKLHPDHGGSTQAMARLNQVRDRLKGAL